MTEDITNSGEGDAPQDATGGGEQPDGGERTFTQAELDAKIKERLRRERDKYADYAELKAAAAKLSEIEEAQKSELEKAQEAAQKAEAEKLAALEKAQEILVQSAFVAEAARAGVMYPEDAYALADLDGIEVDKDGKVSGVAEAVKALVDAGRLVMGKHPAPSLDGGAGSGDGPGGEKPLNAEELAAAKKMGLTPEQYAKGKKRPGTLGGQ